MPTTDLDAVTALQVLQLLAIGIGATVLLPEVF